MQLQTYLDQNKQTYAGFGVLVGASEFGVRKWARRERIPRPKHMRKIQEVTDGAVTPSDFLEEQQGAA